MKRIYERVIEEHFSLNRQMLFLVGPRQVGKTTTSLEVAEPKVRHHYYSWDVQSDREKMVQGAQAVAEDIGLGRLAKEPCFVVFDELHKYSKWKTFLKGFFDLYSKETQILVTGSARLDVYKTGGDSLMGRYFPYRLYPLTVAEVCNPTLRKTELGLRPMCIDDVDFQALVEFGGFPEPFLRKSREFHRRWKRLRAQQLFQEDLRDLTRIQELSQLQLFAELLRSQAGQLMDYSSMAKKVNVSVDTIRRWLETLKSFYYCFSLQPWTKNVTRSLLKQPKVYLYDWSQVEDVGARFENMIAVHLLKAIHFWTDRGLGDYALHFLRDKDQREVDFLVSKNGKPWFLVEAKKSNGSVVPSLHHYQTLTKAPFAFQVVGDLDYVDENCFSVHTPVIVPAKTFLSQLV